MEQSPVLGPLAGITVIDLSRALAGPYASMMLADAGAEVIKIERPGIGDEARAWGPPFVGDGEGAVSTYFLSVNRSKRSVVLDLKDPDDLRVLEALIAEADALIENFRPGVMERLGLAPERLEELNPRLVTLSISGFGEGGPDGHRAGFDQIIQGEAGLMGLTGDPSGPPMRTGIPVADIMAGMFGAYGLVAALNNRERTGRGERVTTSLLASVIAAHTFQGTRWTIAGEVPTRTGNRHPSIAPYGVYECGDGYINIAVATEPLWRRFADLLGLDKVDPRFRDNKARVKNADSLEEAVNSRLRRASTDHWLAKLDEIGVPAGRIRTLDQVYNWEQVRALGLIHEVEHPTAGRIELSGPPLRWSRSGVVRPQPPPLLGEDTDEIVARLRPDSRNRGGTS